MVTRVSRYLGVLVVLLSFVVPTATVTNAAQAGFPLTANTAYCEPGYLGPFVDCTPWDRVLVSFTAVDQDFSTTCVTVPGGSTASCTVEVPFGATIIAAIDPGVVPAGYVLEGPAALEIVIPDGPPEGAFGGPSFVLLPVLNEPPVEAPPIIEEQPVAGGFPLSANAAYCDPGYLGPFVDCEPWAGVMVSFATTDGAFATSCVTTGAERAAGCVVEVPFGSTVIASIDPGAVPAGWVLEGPPSVEIIIPAGPPEGEFDGAAFVLLPAVQGTTVTPTVGPTEATVEVGELPAGLYAGTCADLLAGEAHEPVAGLTGLRVPVGTRVGAADALPVATSFTVVPVPFDQVVDGTHVVAVFDSLNPTMAVACGTIGGVTDDSGALSIGLQPMGGTGTAGVAYLSLGEDGSSIVSLFIGDLMAAPVPGAVGASETTARSGEWPTGVAQLKVNYWGCPPTTDIAGSAETLSDSCLQAVGGAYFYIVMSDGTTPKSVHAPASPSSFWMSNIPAGDVILRMRWWPPTDSVSLPVVFCEGSTLSEATLPYGKMKTDLWYPSSNSDPKDLGINLSLVAGESVECDWFVLASATGEVFAQPLMCGPWWSPANKSFDQLLSECDNFKGGTGLHELTVGGESVTGEPWGNQSTTFENVIPGAVTITQTIQGPYTLATVVCRNSLLGAYASPWNSGPYYQATITAGNSVTGSVEAGDLLTCWFFNVPASSNALPINAVTAVLAPGTEARLR